MAIGLFLGQAAVDSVLLWLIQCIFARVLLRATLLLVALFASRALPIFFTLVRLLALVRLVAAVIAIVLGCELLLVPAPGLSVIDLVVPLFLRGLFVCVLVGCGSAGLLGGGAKSSGVSQGSQLGIFEARLLFVHLLVFLF